MEEEDRSGYFYEARFQLRQILNNLNTIDNEITTLKNIAGETLLIDNNIVAKNQYENSKNKLINAKNSVQNAINTANYHI